MIKWLISKVLPGLADVLANPLWLQSILMRLDLPTLERPIKAYSAFESSGHLANDGEDIVNSEFLIIILMMCMCYKQLFCKDTKKLIAKNGQLIVFSYFCRNKRAVYGKRDTLLLYS